MPTSTENDITGSELTSVKLEQFAADSQSSLPRGTQRNTGDAQGKFLSRGSPCSSVPPVVKILAAYHQPASARSRHTRVLHIRRAGAHRNLGFGTALAHQQQANAFQQVHGFVHSLGQKNIANRFAS